MRRRIDALLHMKRIRRASRPSSVVIRSGPSQREMLEMARGGHLRYWIRIAEHFVHMQSLRDYWKYVSKNTLHRLNEVNVLKVFTVPELNLLIKIKNSGSWIGEHICIPNSIIAYGKNSVEYMIRDNNMT
ncbi:hypothetical protein ACE6H2_002844 [Prunus campanulata]